jgi:hypothetical protein
MIEQSNSIEFYWLALGANPQRAKEADTAPARSSGGRARRLSW